MRPQLRQAMQSDDMLAKNLAQSIAQHLHHVLRMREARIWTRAKFDLNLLTRGLNIAMKGLTDGALEVSLEPGDHDDRYLLQLAHGEEKLVLDTLDLEPTGHYPIRAPGAVMKNQDELTVRVLGHFNDPESRVVALIEQFMK